MKKKWLLSLLAIPLFMGIIALKDNAPIVVKAEEDSSIVEVAEETYTYSDEEGTISVTLRSDFTCKVVLDNTKYDYHYEGEGSYTREGNLVTLIYNGETLEIVVDDDLLTFIEYVEEAIADNSWKDKLNDFKDTYLIPLMSGVSLTSVLSAIISISVAIFNKKTNGKIKLTNDETQKVANGIIASANLLIESIRTQTKLEEDAISQCLEQTNTVITKVSELTNNTEKLFELKQVISKLTELQGIIAQHNKELVGSGVAEQLNGLIEEVKNIK